VDKSFHTPHSKRVDVNQIVIAAAQSKISLDLWALASVVFVKQNWFINVPAITAGKESGHFHGFTEKNCIPFAPGHEGKN